MKLDNGILCLELTNKGGEMSKLTYKGYDVLYKGDGPYWTGKNPTLFPMISSPDKKEYVLDGITYPCRNHGLIRYATLQTIVDNDKEVVMRLTSNDDTKKEYPFDFEYNITYKLDNNKVLINYDITNTGDKQMPFTFGLHPGFNINDFKETEIIFNDDEVGELFNQKTRSSSSIKLGTYTNYLEDLAKLQTIILKNLKSKYVTLKMKEYSINIDMSKFKYLAIWTADPNAKYICIEPWLSVNNIKTSSNPFADEFELEHLKPGETFKIDYYIELN